MSGQPDIEGLAAADIVDALADLMDHRAHIIGLVSPDPTKVLFGQAVTVGFMPRRGDAMDPKRHGLGPAIHRAMGERDPSGRVLVMASNGHPDASLGGGTKLSRVRNLGMAGVLCDGRLRDFETLADYPFSTWCNGETVRAGGNEILAYVADQPVTVAGVTILPDDYVFADASGAAVIPAAAVDDVVGQAHRIKAMAAKMAIAIETERREDVLTLGSGER
jgi:4-hydroxy-4-methyl-2-oxoglutarate aldolase